MFNKKYISVAGFCLLVLCLGCSGGTSGNKSLPAVKVSPVDGKEMVLVPAGEFLFGTDRKDTENLHMQVGTVKPLYVDQQPQQKIALDAYYIDRYEVTNREYRRFLDESGYLDYPPSWEDGKFAEGEENHPVTNVSWEDALTYALWAQKLLPSEQQWEKAARGNDGRLFPWGEGYQKGDANIEIDGAREARPVGSYPKDLSPYGVYDMAGNVMEWTRDWYMPYAGNTYSSKRYGKTFKVLRGNAFQKAGHYFLEAYRYTFHRTEVDPEQIFENVGFRCVLPVRSGKPQASN